jgi:SurA N-terminal domain
MRAMLMLLLFLVCAAPAVAQAPATPCPPAPAATQGAPAPGSARPSPEQLVACVGTRPITGAEFLHWSHVARKALETPAVETRAKDARGSAAAIATEVMGYLISSDWVQAEAQERGIVVSETAVRHTFDHIRDVQFPKRREFRAFLRSSGQTVADLLLRVRLNLLSARIQRSVTAGHHGSGATKALQSFVREFKAKWTAQTYCEPAYAVPDCGHVQGPL